ncbi:hypothetical protein BD626DRAFT_575181 [Schizophyllum amplum]|uniref:F-box domain-containing protein n=1 Tax=Schizophyllum amplum TaxID=97359 RepID=A0A550BW91_9AGAR|nr:hypothetical protein BD626DRAFT_575181 [Auriculariopsis ampla]
MSDAWPALDLLLNESDRWRACFVRDIANVDSTPREFPSLEHLRFDHSRGTQYFRRAPALCSYAGLFDEDMDLPWHQLTSVTLEAINNVGPIDIVSALACCTRATFFRAMCTAVSGKQRLVIDAECPSLRRLELVVNDFDFRSKNTRYLLPRVLDCVTAPRLTSLDIERFRKAPWNWSNKSTDALAACLDRSHTALTSLALRNVQITPSQMCRLFKSLPALEQLTWWETVKCHHSDLNMLAAAIGPGTESSECPLPRLAHLEIRGNLQHSVDPQSAARIICYRARNTALRHVVLDYCTLDQAIRDELGELLDSFVVCGRGC